MSERKARLACAIYTRKSSEEGLEQEFNSLDAQREACEAYILSQRHEGWQALDDRYDDGGYSGGNMTEARNLLGLAPDEDPWTALDSLSAARHAEIAKRLSEVGDVYRTLSGIFPDAKKAGEWIHTPLEALEGETPINVMLREGETGLLTVMEYLHSLQNH
jgi:hypothetical protein